AEDEKRRLDPVPVEQVEGPVGIPLEPRLEPIPLLLLDDLVERPDLEVVLQGDGHDVAFGVQGVGHHRTPASRGRAGSSAFRSAWTMRWPASPRPNGFSTATTGWRSTSARQAANASGVPA